MALVGPPLVGQGTRLVALCQTYPLRCAARGTVQGPPSDPPSGGGVRGGWDTIVGGVRFASPSWREPPLWLYAGTRGSAPVRGGGG